MMDLISQVLWSSTATDVWAVVGAACFAVVSYNLFWIRWDVCLRRLKAADDQRLARIVRDLDEAHRAHVAERVAMANKGRAAWSQVADLLAEDLLKMTELADFRWRKLKIYREARKAVRIAHAAEVARFQRSAARDTQALEFARAQVESAHAVKAEWICPDCGTAPPLKMAGTCRCTRLKSYGPEQPAVAMERREKERYAQVIKDCQAVIAEQSREVLLAPVLHIGEVASRRETLFDNKVSAQVPTSPVTKLIIAGHGHTVTAHGTVVKYTHTGWGPRHDNPGVGWDYDRPGMLTVEFQLTAVEALPAVYTSPKKNPADPKTEYVALWKRLILHPCRHQFADATGRCIHCTISRRDWRAGPPPEAIG